MGLFGKMIKDAVSEAVNNAVEKTVAPRAEKLANKAAEHINAATEAIEEHEEKTGTTLKDVFANLEKAAEKFSDEAEKLTADSEKVAEIVTGNALADFPKWTVSKITDMNTEETDEYVVIRINAEGEWEDILKYIKALEDAGFTGDEQIQRKKINGYDHVVDFSFAAPEYDNEIAFYIMKG